jgi:gliding motility-associated-like protein
MRVYLSAWWIIANLAIGVPAFSTHIRAGELIITRDGCQQREFTITLTMYGNTNSIIRPGDGVLSFGDGTTLVTPLGAFTPRPDLASEFGVYTFSVKHTYALSGEIVVSYQETNRNSGILNIQESGITPFFIQSMLVIDPQLCNSSPALLSAPIDKACSKLAFYHNPGVFDAEGDSISYSLVTPKSSATKDVTYLSPDNATFYGTDFNTGNESGNGKPAFLIDAFSGTISWDSPGNVGEYNIAFMVSEWRKINDKYSRVGYVIRDMQIIVEECVNKRPELVVPEDICVLAGTPINSLFIGSDPDGHDIKMEAFSGIFSLANGSATIQPDQPGYQPSGSSISFSWTPLCEAVRTQPYQVTIKITDNPPTGPKLVQYKVWNIKVLAPPPTITQASLDIVNRKTWITWDAYSCANISKFLIWRRVSPNPFVQDDCSAGVPKFAGYTRIAEVSPNLTSFSDDNQGKGLSVGAVYCYRLTAVMISTDGVESQVSTEWCVPPILAEAPVITHVSISKTDESNGAVVVSWRKPFDFSNPDYQNPYQYSLLRADGLSGDTNIQQVHVGTIADTTFTDSGIDTKNLAHNYRIVLHARTFTGTEFVSIDTSAVASSVWNSFVPRESSIELNWIVDTPWNNSDPQNPYHLIYRRDESSPNTTLVLIDSVNVLENGFTYTDHGEYLNRHLTSSEFYYYQIKTRGTYGNPSISSPLENLSNVIGATILDDKAPYSPKVNEAKTDCEQFNLTVPCSQQSFTNEITWDKSNDLSCEEDVFEYHVFAADSKTGNFVLIGKTQGNSFRDQHLTNKARCYQVMAVDRAGNESETSNMVCFDNCPSINFPNVFTPNDDDYNPLFTTYSDDAVCTRFVEHIDMTIFDRWGKKVIDLQDDASVQWDGKDDAGHVVPTGVYFYRAVVLFNVIEPDKKLSQVKGWINVVR